MGSTQQSKLTKLYPMTIISSNHQIKFAFFRNHLPRILKMICRNKIFNPPVLSTITWYLYGTSRQNIFWLFKQEEIAKKNGINLSL